MARYAMGVIPEKGDNPLFRGLLCPYVKSRSCGSIAYLSGVPWGCLPSWSRTLVGANILHLRGAVPVLSFDEARALTDRIKVNLGVTWELVTEAYLGRAWAALGYTSWGAYCAGELDLRHLRLPRDKRMEGVAALYASGMSLRAVAEATGYSRETIRQDLSGDQKLSPDTLGMDGKEYPRPPTPPEKPEPSVARLLVALERAVTALESRLEDKPHLPDDAGVILGDLAVRVAQLEEAVLMREDRRRPVPVVPVGERLILVPPEAGCPDCGKADGHEPTCPVTG